MMTVMEMSMLRRLHTFAYVSCVYGIIIVRSTLYNPANLFSPMVLKRTWGLPLTQCCTPSTCLFRDISYEASLKPSVLEFDVAV